MTAPRDPLRFAVLCLALATPPALAALAALNLLAARDLDGLAARQEATVAALERRVREAESRPVAQRDGSAIYVPGATAELAKASLRRLLTDAVAASGGSVIETLDAPAPEAEDAGGERVRLRVAFDADNAGLLALMHGLETGLPLIAIERLEIRRLEAGGEGDPENPALRVGLVAAGPVRSAAP
ncbi:type II secretion system protein GspM [Methylopila henanensis]|uniref:Type II secretion system protein GspM n=1 Tax=Methylopila henanensis TaxID=873516 RepID=A0ABW4K4M1_9HYPH